MRVLIADDDPVSRLILERALAAWKYEVIVANDGGEAWGMLQGPDTPRLAILDWSMPALDGVEVCRRLRAADADRPIYVLLLTGRGRKEDVVAGLEAGADDYLIKPFDREELRARLHVGERVIRLQSELASRVLDLEAALAQVKELNGLLPICSYCKKIRDDQDYWHQVENYVGDHSRARFSHGICPECYEKILKPEIERMESD